MCTRELKASPRGGFTLVELLVVIGIIAVLIAVLLPALQKAQEGAYRSACMSNQRQLVIAWQMYADDYKGSICGSTPQWNPPLPWFHGGNTERHIKEGALYKYTKSTKVYHCPGDFGFHLVSYGLNCYLNGESFGGSPVVTKRQKIRKPTETFVFIDENDYRFSGGYWNIGSFGLVNGDSWIDYPGWWHSKGAVVSFADGHVSYLKWVDSRTWTMNTNSVSTPNNKDLKNLQKIKGW